ncbi:hypothetical protein GCM10010109_68990 [Actinoplanes campanulatus]|nr:hypothetical protein GCM10010109_68990 [Actinoplanes campanulatus]GID42404.1 hypothetical protein Aca09nite_89100 [Actinoplanes campanulatus]
MGNGRWQGSDRRQRLPQNWPSIQRRILKNAEFRCTVRTEGKRCTEQATEVDHIRAGDDHRDSNLRAICGWHHQQKSSREGGEAYAANRRRQAAKFKRTEAHPGLL